MSNEMLYKNIKTFLFILVAMLVFALIYSNIYSCSIRRSDSKRAAELETRAVKYEKLYTETDLLYKEALGTIERSEAELENLRTTHSRLREIESELREENRIFERTIDELGKLGNELAEGDGRAEELIRAIEREAQRALESVERLQAGSEEPD